MGEILRQRNFLLLWTGQVISNLGDWLTAIALPFYVYNQTHSPVATGATFMTQTLPPILFGSIAGVWVDRWDHRKTMILMDVSRAAVSSLFVLVALTGWLWVAYLAAFIQATLALFFNPTRNAILPALVRSDVLITANTLNSIGSDIASLVGPALGGLIAYKLGLGGAAVLDALSFCLSAGLISQIKYCHQPHTGVKQPAKPFWQEWREGLNWIKQNQTLIHLFAILGIAMLGQGMISVLWIIFVNQILQGSSLEYGIVQVAVAIGGILGALLNMRLSRGTGLARLVGVSGMLVGLMLLLTFLLPVFSVILALQVVCGIAAVGFFVSQQTILQMTTPGIYLGRVFGLYQMTNALALLLGQSIGSALGGVFGTVAMLTLAALLYFISGAYALRSLQVGVRVDPAG